MKTVLDALPVEFQQFKDFIYSLASLFMQSRLFPSSHPSVEKTLSDAYLRLSVLLQKKKSVTFKFVKGNVYYLNFKVNISDTDEKALHFFRRNLSKLSVGEMVFEGAVGKDELKALMEALNGEPDQRRFSGASEAWLGISNIRVRHEAKIAEEVLPEWREVSCRSLVLRPVAGNAPSGSGPGRKIGRMISDVLGKLEKIQPLEGMRAGNKVLELVEKEGRNTTTVLLLNSLREYDDYTFTHSVNVAVISAAIAKSVGFSDEDVDSLAMAALFHDIGKLYIPKEILYKEGRLSPMEWQVVKKHPVHGEMILREEGVDLLSRYAAYEHHMRYDLTGYPAPKSGYRVHKISHIIRIADSYDALTTKRPYRRQISPYEAVRLMVKYRGTEFHPELLDVFMRVLGNIPIGSVLELDTGETVLVVVFGEGAGILPHVRVLKDAEGRDVEDETIIDLNEWDKQRNRYKRKPVRIVTSPVRNVDVGKYLVETR